MLSVLKGSSLRRRLLSHKAAGTPMEAFYNASWPKRATPLEHLEFIAVDLETTGLSPNQHEIVSIGWCVIRGMTILYGDRGHVLCKPEKEVSEESAVIHTLTDDMLADAPPLCESLEAFLPHAAGRVLIAHHCKIETGFLDKACKKCFGLPFEMPTIDTMGLEIRTLMRRNEAVEPGMLRLDALRSRYNLPRYKSHNAMIDAIAAGELFLAQAAHRSGKDGKIELRDVCV
ncbi:exonuclease domain-containing protein [Magnetovibrio sp. PR-2]|uniref:exonuclease domain-containing protein n=1 Tax=Magnetovibrio sp. PR-2 TaxID=3120356 RepID=UPI002FCE2D21